VAIGMVLAFRFSEARGLCKAGTAARVIAHLAAAGLPTRVADVNFDRKVGTPDFVALMQQDKKVVSGAATLILARGIGEAFISRDFGWDAIADFLAGAAP
jgi:3-dehydroquinate synthetase